MDLILLLGIASALLVVLLATWLLTRKPSTAEPNQEGLYCDDISMILISICSSWCFVTLFQCFSNRFEPSSTHKPW